MVWSSAVLHELIQVLLFFYSTQIYFFSKIFIRTQEHDECDDYVTLITILTYERVTDNHFRSTCKQAWMCISWVSNLRLEPLWYRLELLAAIPEIQNV